MIFLDKECRRFHIGYNLTLIVGNKAVTTTEETTINGANSSAAIASIKQEIFITKKSQKPLIKINFCVEVEQ